MADNPQAMAELRRLLAAREPLYAEAAHTVDTSRLDAAGVARAVERGGVRRKRRIDAGRCTRCDGTPREPTRPRTRCLSRRRASARAAFQASRFRSIWPLCFSRCSA